MGALLRGTCSFRIGITSLRVAIFGVSLIVVIPRCDAERFDSLSERLFFVAAASSPNAPESMLSLASIRSKRSSAVDEARESFLLLCEQRVALNRLVVCLSNLIRVEPT